MKAGAASALLHCSPNPESSLTVAAWDTRHQPGAGVCRRYCLEGRKTPMAGTKQRSPRVVCPSCRKRVARDKSSTATMVVYPVACPHCQADLVKVLKADKLLTAGQVEALMAASRKSRAGTRDKKPPADPVKQVLGGRPTKLSMALIEEAAGYIEQGAYNTTVQRALGISESAWYAWLERGKAALQKPVKDRNATDSLCAAFALTVDQADAKGEIQLMQGPRSGALGWQGQAWMLERKYRDRWGRARAEAPSDTGALEDLVAAIGQARAARA